MGTKRSKPKKVDSTAVIESEPIFPSEQALIIFLGNNGSGKSTVWKSIQYQGQLDELSESDQRYLIEHILVICIQTMATLINATQSLLPHNTELIEATEHLQLIINFVAPLDVQQKHRYGRALSFLWTLNVIQAAFKHLTRVADNIDYFFDRIHIISADDYVLSYEDMIRIHLRTTGFCDFKRDFVGRTYSFMDIGGRRSERKKWMRFLNENTAFFIFVCDLSGYGQQDPFVDGIRLNESLKLFKAVMSGKLQVHKPVVLLLNKTDLFKKRLKRVSLKTCFDDYDGRIYQHFKESHIFDMIIKMFENDLNLDIPKNIHQSVGRYCAYLTCDYWMDLCYRDGVEFIKNKYLKLAPENMVKEVYETCAIQPDNIEKVMNEIFNKDVFGFGDCDL